MSVIESSSFLSCGKFSGSHAHECLSKSTFSDCILSSKYTYVSCSSGACSRRISFTLPRCTTPGQKRFSVERLIEQGYALQTRVQLPRSPLQGVRSKGIKISRKFVRTRRLRSPLVSSDRSLKCFEQFNSVIPALGETQGRECSVLPLPPPQ